MQLEMFFKRQFVSWMGLVLLAAGILFYPRSAAAQETALDTLAVGETLEQLVGSFSGSQAGYENWTEGGVNTLSLTANLRGKLVGVGQQWKQRHETRMAYGTVKTEDRDYRKAVDVIRAVSTLLYRGDGLWQTFKPTVGIEGRTQFTSGFNYDTNPFPNDRDLPVKVSDFMAPAYISETIGLTYERGEWFSQRLGFSSKQTIVAHDDLRLLYGVDPDDLALIEVGVESLTNFDRLILPRTRFNSSLTLFKAFRNLAFPDVYWENVLEIQANQWLTTNVSAVLLYNEDVSSDLQLKEVISVGVSFTLI